MLSLTGDGCVELPLSGTGVGSLVVPGGDRR